MLICVAVVVDASRGVARFPASTVAASACSGRRVLPCTPPIGTLSNAWTR